MHRCRVSPQDLLRDLVRLPPDAAHHLAHVLRAGPGTRIQLFDGRGGIARGEIQTVSVDGVEVRVSDRDREPDADGTPRVVLLQALPKGRIMDWIVEKATEIGVDMVIPVVADRSVCRPDEGRAGARVGRWGRIAEAATRQCGAAFVPEVTPLYALEEALVAAGSLDLLLVCSVTAGAVPLGQVLGDRLSAAWAVGVMIGPEGDWSPAEVSAALRRGGVPVSLGRRVLRVETAALYALSALACAAASHGAAV